MEPNNKRPKVKCPVPSCDARVKNLKKHLLTNKHKWSEEKALTARQDFGLRQKRKRLPPEERKTKERHYRPRICPICGRLLVRLENHLRQYHAIQDHKYRKELLDKAAYDADENENDDENEIIYCDDESQDNNIAFVKNEWFKARLRNDYGDHNNMNGSDPLYSEHGESEEEDNDPDWLEAEKQRIDHKKSLVCSCQ